jgi:hypothetical protein
MPADQEFPIAAVIALKRLKRNHAGDMKKHQMEKHP